MRRALPILIALCLIAAVFLCLPRDSDGAVFYSSADELNGRRIGMKTGMNYEEELVKVCPEAEPVFFNDLAAMLPSLRQGKVDAVLIEDIYLAVERLEIPSLCAVEGRIATLDNTVGVKKCSQGGVLLRQINEFTAKLKADGTLGKMNDYWFGEYDRETAAVDKSGITGENGVLHFGGEAATEPLCFAGEAGELLGYNVEYVYRFCREYGYEPVIDTLTYDAMLAGLASGKCDAALGVLPDEKRADEISFSEPVSQYGLVAVYDCGGGESGGFFEKTAGSFYKTFILEARWQMFLRGVGTTMVITVLSAIFGTGFGLLLFIWCWLGKKTEKAVTKVMCWIVGSTPSVVVLMILYYVIFGKYSVSNIAVAVIGFALIFGCGFYEELDSGVSSVDAGQEDAAKAQGFTKSQAFFHILLPQTAEIIMPAYRGRVISLLQETSVVGYIAIMDLTKMSDLVRGRTYEAFFPLLATAGIYFLLIWLLTVIIGRIARAANTKARSKDKILNGITDEGA